MFKGIEKDFSWEINVIESDETKYNGYVTFDITYILGDTKLYSDVYVGEYYFNNKTKEINNLDEFIEVMSESLKYYNNKKSSDRSFLFQITKKGNYVG